MQNSKTTITEKFTADEFMVLHSAVHTQKAQLEYELNNVQIEDSKKDQIQKFLDQLNKLDQRFGEHMFNLILSGK